MPIEVTARHVSISTHTQERIQAKAETLLQEFPQIGSIHVILDKQHNTFEAEYIVHHKHAPQLSGKVSDENLIVAADGAHAKVWRQLRKHADKDIASHHDRSTIREQQPGNA